MSPNTMSEVLVDLLRTDTALFLADRPDIFELAQFIDGLAQVQGTLDEVRTTVCREFAGRLEAGVEGSDRGPGEGRLRGWTPAAGTGG